jgi:hypothetical protein
VNDAVADALDFARVERGNRVPEGCRRVGRLDDAGLELATAGAVEE